MFVVVFLIKEHSPHVPSSHLANSNTGVQGFDRRDSCVNTLIVANFNLLSLAIQGVTQRFELIERFIKVRNLL